ncbi:unnamed protein product [Microthlaspi erraticum]|uniref:Anaphase-promoting complex subunit 4 WD40 domain-containing protein n=1 Tax=Microthlaspi erraticum TaxID=1685480 RepID=A0A6D2IXU8_9BRAS|nr:unnamed protein product [Microthlaspi erraticum]
MHEEKTIRVNSLLFLSEVCALLSRGVYAEKVSVPAGHQGDVWQMEWDMSGMTLASIGSGGMVKLWQSNLNVCFCLLQSHLSFLLIDLQWWYNFASHTNWPVEAFAEAKPCKGAALNSGDVAPISE